MEKIGIGIIGVGFIGQWHIEALRRFPGVEVVALAVTSEAEVQQRCRDLDVPRGYGDWHKLVHDPEVQVVHICSPTHLHYEMAKTALEAGKHVLCEKPFTIRSSEARELTDLATAKRLAGGIHFNVRYYPLVHHIRDLVAKGELGRLIMVSGTYHQDLLVKDSDYNWRMDPEYDEYARVVSDIGSHWFDAAEFMSGLRVNSLYADFTIVHKIRKKPLHPQDQFSYFSRGGYHPHVVNEFVVCALTGKQPYYNAERGAGLTAACLYAHESALKGRAMVDIPVKW